MTEVTNERVKSMSDMVRIALSEEEVEIYTKQLNEIIENVNKIHELNTDDVDPTTHGTLNMVNVLREDNVVDSITQEEVLKNAPDKQDGHFKVPSIME